MFDELRPLSHVHLDNLRFGKVTDASLRWRTTPSKPSLCRSLAARSVARVGAHSSMSHQRPTATRALG